MGKRRRHGASNSSIKLYAIGGVIILALMATALVFVLLLRPADSEYNNTIPAVMGVLTMITAIVTPLLTLIKNEQNHRENKELIPKAVEEAVQHVTQDLPIVQVKQNEDGIL